MEIKYKEGHVILSKYDLVSRYKILSIRIKDSKHYLCKLEHVVSTNTHVLNIEHDDGIMKSFILDRTYIINGILNNG